MQRAARASAANNTPLSSHACLSGSADRLFLSGTGARWHLLASCYVRKPKISKCPEQGNVKKKERKRKKRKKSLQSKFSLCNSVILLISPHEGESKQTPCWNWNAWNIFAKRLSSVSQPSVCAAPCSRQHVSVHVTSFKHLAPRSWKPNYKPSPAFWKTPGDNDTQPTILYK